MLTNLRHLDAAGMVHAGTGANFAEALEPGGHGRTFLLHGVTGSGKTEVYLQALEKAVSQGKRAIVLVPEISLTPQLVRRFSARFGHGVAVLHSGLTDSQRRAQWRRIRKGEAWVAVGAVVVAQRAPQTQAAQTSRAAQAATSAAQAPRPAITPIAARQAANPAAPSVPLGTAGEHQALIDAFPLAQKLEERREQANNIAMGGVIDVPRKRTIVEETPQLQSTTHSPWPRRAATAQSSSTPLVACRREAG